MHESSSPESNREMRLRGRISKSMSVGTGLDKEGKLSCGIDYEEETEQAICGGESHESNCSRSYDACDYDGFEEQSDPVMLVHSHYQKVMRQGETTSTVGDPEQLEEGTGDSATDFSGDRAGDSLSTAPSITKSYYLPNMGDSPKSGEVSTSEVHVEPGSSQNSDGLDADRKEFLSHGVRTKAIADQEKDNTKLEWETDRCKSSFIDEYDNFNFDGAAKDWSSPGKDYQRQSSVRCDELPNKEYKIKRIEEWVRMIDLEDRDHLQEMSEGRMHVQEIGESSQSIEKVRKHSDVVGGLTSAKLEGKVSTETMHSMEAAKNYISSLTAASTSAQLVNLGLAVIPFLSSFASLKVLNLSGNAIVRITTGALPSSLHALNLSKNNISTIEGLRELTRLRLLDLSYNRVLRIGHGLTS